MRPSVTKTRRTKLVLPDQRSGGRPCHGTSRRSRTWTCGSWFDPRPGWRLIPSSSGVQERPGSHSSEQPDGCPAHFPWNQEHKTVRKRSQEVQRGLANLRTSRTCMNSDNFSTLFRSHMNETFSKNMFNQRIFIRFWKNESFSAVKRKRYKSVSF